MRETKLAERQRKAKRQRKWMRWKKKKWGEESPWSVRKDKQKTERKEEKKEGGERYGGWKGYMDSKREWERSRNGERATESKKRRKKFQLSFDKHQCNQFRHRLKQWSNVQRGKVTHVFPEMRRNARHSWSSRHIWFSFNVVTVVA